MSGSETVVGTSNIGGFVRTDQHEHSQKSPKRKQASALRTLKDSLKFKGSVNIKKTNSMSGSAASSKVRSSSISKEDTRRAKQRLSAQRVSLFKYDNVRAMSYSVPVTTRRGSDSSRSSITVKSGDTFSDSSIQTINSVRMKPTTLMACGTLELYQIFTPSLDSNEKRQEMNYLSLGRKDNIVHPILPRLQVTKLQSPGYRFLISFHNPQRFWEIEFLPTSSEKSMLRAIRAFESVISKICKYATISDEQEEDHKERESPKRSIEKGFLEDSLQKDHTNNDNLQLEEEGNDEDDDDLSYLLEEGEGEGEEEEEEDISESTEHFERRTGYKNRSDSATQLNEQSSDTTINEAFRRAMQNVKPSCTQRVVGSERRFNDSMHSSRGFSSYEPRGYSYLEQSKTLSKRLSYVRSKSSSSVLMEVYGGTEINITKRDGNAI